MATDLQSTIFEGVTGAIDASLRAHAATYKFDKTVMAEVVQIVDEQNREYKVKYESNIFSAFAINDNIKIKVKDNVYVLVPQGDFSNKKFITDTVGRNTVDTTSQTSLRNLVLETSPNLGSEKFYKFTSENVVSAKRTDSHNTTLPPFDDATINRTAIDTSVSNLFNFYKYFKIKADFLPILDAPISAGNYGLKIYYGDNDEDFITFDIKDFYGNPYVFNVMGDGFDDYVHEEAILDFSGIPIEKFKGIKKITAFVNEDDLNLIKEIDVKNVELYFVEIIDNSGNNLYLTIDTPQGVEIGDENLSPESITLQGKLYAQGKNVINDGDCEIEWFEQDPSVMQGHNDYSEKAGPGWRSTGVTSADLVLNSSVNFLWRKKYRLIVVYKESATLEDEIFVYRKGSKYDFEAHVHMDENEEHYYLHVRENPKYENKNVIQDNWILPDDITINDYEVDWYVMLPSNNYINMPLIKESIANTDARWKQKKVETSFHDFETRGVEVAKHYDEEELKNVPIEDVKDGAFLYETMTTEITEYKNYTTALYYAMIYEVPTPYHNYDEDTGLPQFPRENGKARKFIGVLEYEFFGRQDDKENYPIGFIGKELYQYNADGEINMVDAGKAFSLQAKLPFKDARIKWSMNGKELNATSKYNPDNSMLSDIWVDNYGILRYNIKQRYNSRAYNNTLNMCITSLSSGKTRYFKKEILFVKDGDQGTNGSAYVVKVIPIVSPNNRTKLSGFQGMDYGNNNSQLYLCAFVYRFGVMINTNKDYKIKFEWGNNNNAPLFNTIENNTEVTYQPLNLTDWYGDEDEIPHDIAQVTWNEQEHMFEHPDLMYIPLSVSITTVGDNIVAEDVKDLKLSYIYPVCVYDSIDVDKYDIFTTMPQYIQYTTTGTNAQNYYLTFDMQYKGEYLDVIATEKDEENNEILINDITKANLLGSKSNIILKDDKNNNKRSITMPLVFQVKKHPIEMIKAIWKDEKNVKHTVYYSFVLFINKYGSAILNNWNGTSVQISENQGYILAPMIGAGKKNDKNEFSGVIMGEWTQQFTNDSLTKDITNGLYGFDKGVNTFGLLDNGNAYFGKRGQGRMVIDVNSIKKNWNNMEVTGAAIYGEVYDPSGISVNPQHPLAIYLHNQFVKSSGRTNKYRAFEVGDPDASDGGDKKFYIDYDGYFKASYGKIGGWDIDDTGIHFGNKTALNGSDGTISTDTFIINNNGELGYIKPKKNVTDGGFGLKADDAQAIILYTKGNIRLSGQNIFLEGVPKEGETCNIYLGTGDGPFFAIYTGNAILDIVPSQLLNPGQWKDWINSIVVHPDPPSPPSNGSK